MDFSKADSFTLSHTPGENEAINETIKLWQDHHNKSPTVEYLPPGLSKTEWLPILRSFKEAIGEDAVILGNAHKHNYGDPFAMCVDEDEKRGSACALRPARVEDIQKILKIANEHKLPLWTVSRGRNLGYGGPAGRVKVSSLSKHQELSLTLSRVLLLLTYKT